MTDTPPEVPAGADPASVETLALVAKAAADKAIAATDVPSWKPATVLEVVGNVATVHVDGDPPEVTIQAEILASPTPYAGARVMIKFQPPSGAFVESWISRPDPAGEVKTFARTSAPPGYLPCDGAAVDRATYAALFEAIGTAFGTGDGTTTFNVPNLRDRFIAGIGGAYALGASGGADTVTLTAHQTPIHSHSMGSHDHAIAAHSHTASHSHSFSGLSGSGGSHNHSIGGRHNSQTTHAHHSSPGYFAEAPSPYIGEMGTVVTGFHQGHTHSVSGSVGTSEARTSQVATDAGVTNLGNTGSIGGGGSHENRPPFMALLYCISY